MIEFCYSSMIGKIVTIPGSVGSTGKHGIGTGLTKVS